MVVCPHLTYIELVLLHKEGGTGMKDSGTTSLKRDKFLVVSMTQLLHACYLGHEHTEYEILGQKEDEYASSILEYSLNTTLYSQVNYEVEEFVHSYCS